MAVFECVLWGALAHYGAGRRRRLTACLLAAGLVLSMAAQLWLLHLDGLLSVQTGLPLHLCGFSALACVLLCFRFSKRLYHFLLLLGVPGAALALVFPAVTTCSRPFLMRVAFLRLHALIIAVAVFFAAQKKPLPAEPQETFLLGNGLMLFAAVTNRLTGSNYLFLRAAPAGTPLAMMIVHGYPLYIAGLELLCMLLLTQLCSLYLRNQESI